MGALSGGPAPASAIQGASLDCRMTAISQRSRLKRLRTDQGMLTAAMTALGHSNVQVQGSPPTIGNRQGKRARSARSRGTLPIRQPVHVLRLQQPLRSGQADYSLANILKKAISPPMLVLFGTGYIDRLISMNRLISSRSALHRMATLLSDIP